MIEFHQYHRAGAWQRVRGVVYAVVDPETQKAGIGCSLCSFGRGDTFDPKFGREIARQRALKAMKRDKNPFAINPGEDARSLWSIHGIGPGGQYPVSMEYTVSRIYDRVIRCVESVVKKEDLTSAVRGSDS